MISSTERCAIHSAMIGREVAAVGEQLAVFLPFGMADHHAEVEPLLAGPDAEADNSVARRFNAGRNRGAPGTEGPADHVEVA